MLRDAGRVQVVGLSCGPPGLGPSPVRALEDTLGARRHRRLAPTRTASCRSRSSERSFASRDPSRPPKRAWIPSSPGVRRFCPFVDVPAVRPLPGIRRSRSVPTEPSVDIPFRPRGFAPPRRFSPRDGSRACCIPLPTMGFVPFPALQSEDLPVSRNVYHPSKNSPDPPWAPRSPGALAPLMFLLVPPYLHTAAVASRGAEMRARRACHLRGFFRRIGP